ncbi:hypothetical protein PsAD13_03196 [Pseudovibrio sp. Ad13]|uniref:hypothetical protein n=1 Tax=Pseudovibrio sp. Ad13 TaxID=989396 RepID=UPI0007AEC685|nr:hypothetical protein [Pseudovibrio sp. Ad13]KZK82994.1 hypothetical protein PsAD13_03196 [Pseudovibrio sp. Ad13]
MTGWIRIDRALFDHQALSDPWEWGCWCWLISQAAWRETSISRRGKKIDVAAGQLCYSFRFLSKKWGCSVGKTRRLLNRFAEWNMIEIETGTGESLITICNYGKYQDAEAGGETVTEHKRARERNAGGTPASTKKNKRTNKQGNTEPDSQSTDVDLFEPTKVVTVEEVFAQYVAAVDDYNADLAPGAIELPKPSVLSEKRHAALKRALKAIPAGKTFADVLKAIGMSPHLLGFNDRQWRVDIDFLCQKDKLIQILEGKYFGSSGGSKAQGNGRVSGADLFK